MNRLPFQFYYFHPTPIVAARVPCDQDIPRLIDAAYDILTAVHAAYRSEHVQQKGLHGDASSALTAWCLYAGSSTSNYAWMLRTAQELCNEYAFRFSTRNRHPKESAFQNRAGIGIPPAALTNATPGIPPDLAYQYGGDTPQQRFCTAYLFFHIRDDATWTNRSPSVEPCRQIAANVWQLAI